MLTFPDRDPACWKSRAYWGSSGGLHSLVAACLDFEPALHNRIEGKATILSDKQVFSSILYGIENPTLVEHEFLGNWDNIVEGFEGLANYLEFSEDDRHNLRQSLLNWVAIDYAGVTKC